MFLAPMCMTFASCTAHFLFSKDTFFVCWVQECLVQIFLVILILQPYLSSFQNGVVCFSIIKTFCSFSIQMQAILTNIRVIPNRIDNFCTHSHQFFSSLVQMVSTMAEEHNCQISASHEIPFKSYSALKFMGFPCFKFKSKVIMFSHR